jgi:hypothetical protein
MYRLTKQPILEHTLHHPPMSGADGFRVYCFPAMRGGLERAAYAMAFLALRAVRRSCSAFS